MVSQSIVKCFDHVKLIAKRWCIIIRGARMPGVIIYIREGCLSGLSYLEVHGPWWLGCCSVRIPSDESEQNCLTLSAWRSILDVIYEDLKFKKTFDLYSL